MKIVKVVEFYRLISKNRSIGLMARLESRIYVDIDTFLQVNVLIKNIEKTLPSVDIDNFLLVNIFLSLC